MLVKRSMRTRPMIPLYGTTRLSRAPADSLTRSLSEKAEVAMAAANIKAAALDADVVAVVAVATIRAAAVTKNVADTDTTGKAVGANVCTTKGTKAHTTKATRALVTKAVGAGPTTAGQTMRRILHRYSLSLRTLRASTTCTYPTP